MTPRARAAMASVAVLVLVAGCAGGGTPTPASTPGPAAIAASTAVPTLAPAMATPAPTRAPSPPPTATPMLATIGLPADDGARIVAVEAVTTLQHTAWVRVGDPQCPAHDQYSDLGCWVKVGDPVATDRIVDLTIESPVALRSACGTDNPLPTGPTKVRLFLPKHFTEQPATRWPVLYLHHGACTDYAFWSEGMDPMTLTNPTDLLVVMPDGDTFDPPNWDTYHLTELRQLLERNWRAGDKRAIARASMGGAEAIEEAEREPGTFRFAGAYSGGLDQMHVSLPELAAGLTGTSLFVSYGNGQPGPLDNGEPSPWDPDGTLEAGVAVDNAAFVQVLKDLKIPATVDAYGNGTHDPNYFQREFERSFPPILRALGE